MDYREGKRGFSPLEVLDLFLRAETAQHLLIGNLGAESTTALYG